MKRRKRHAPQSESLRLKWEKRTIFEKGYTGSCAGWMAERLEALLDHILCGHATVAHRKQDGGFRMTKATLIYCETEFRRKYDPMAVEGAVVHRSVDEQRRTTFQVENLMEWGPTV